MKKGFKYSMAAIVAASALTPVMASAAENDTVAPGVYNTSTNETLTLSQFQDLSTSAKGKWLANSNVYVVVDGLAYKGTNIITLSDADLMASGVPAKDVITQPSVPGELKVESVSAINAKEIKVNFNQKVTKATAEWSVATDAGNITVKPTGGAAVNVTSKLAADGLSATLTLDGAAVLANETGYDVTVGTGVLNEKGEGLKQASTSTFQFNDKVKPTVTSVQSVNGDVVVTFSEKLNATATTVVINGQDHTVTPTSGDTKITVAKSNFTGAAALEAGKNYTVVVAGAEDLAGNAMNLYSGSVQYSVITDTVAPTVSSVTAVDEKTFNVKFSEELAYTANAPTAAELGLTVNKSDGSAVTPLTVTTEDGITFKVVVPTVYGANSSTEKITVNLNGYKDVALNLGQSKSTQLTLTKDTVAPKLVKSEYNANTGKITLTFDEVLKAEAAGAAGTFEPALSIVNDATGQTVAVVAGSVEAVAAGSKTVVIDNATAALANGNYTLHVSAAAVTDTAFTPNTSAAFSTKVVITGSATVKPTLTSATANSTNLITVTFGTAKVKGGNVAGSATDASNYKLNGAALPAGSLLTIDAANEVVSIQLPEGSIDNSATQILTISGVQAVGSSATIDTVNSTVTLTDTKKPEITSAIINTTGDIVLTFSESINGTTTGTGTQPVIGDFIVAVDGATVASGLSVANGEKNNQLVIKSSDVSFATGTVTVKATGTTTGADAAGNTISTVNTVTATR
ncbi:beta strand repeat-containing protein [Sporosarcina soli]|uniref:Beta strand repeat-containing protein n=1 Tax=Sporosarcina soli TaxID=334736 RepID=A0ABW0TL30_9BACL